jgi:hypothetical protein
LIELGNCRFLPPAADRPPATLYWRRRGSIPMPHKRSVGPERA